MDEQECAALCRQVAEYSVTELGQQKPERLGPRGRMIEIDRLQRLLCDWLTVERERADFVVSEREEQRQIRFGPLEIRARIDRIDQLADGSQLVIDYKTGKPSLAQWSGERPDDPQLPLYWLMLQASGTAVSGLLFGQVKQNQGSWLGLGPEHSAEPLIAWDERSAAKTGELSWATLNQRWQRTLHALAQSFIAGVADIDPKQPAQTCQYCDLQPLCRIDIEQEDASDAID